MFSIKVNGKWLEFAPDQNVQLVHSCPVFDPDRMGRTFSFPFKLPLTPRNQSTLRFAYRFDAKRNWDNNAGELYIASSLYESGQLAVIGSTGNSLDTVFQNAPVEQVELLNNINLWEIMEQVSVPSTGPAAQITLTVLTPPRDYVISIETNIYSLTYAETVGMTTSEVADDLRDQINVDYPGMASTTTGTVLHLESDDVDAHNPEWSSMQGLTILSYWTLGKVTQRNLVNYAKVLKATPSSKFCFPVIRWENLYDTVNPAYTKAVNLVLGDDTFENTPYVAEHNWEYTFIPFLRLTYILNRIASAAGIGSVTQVGVPDWENIVIPNNMTLDKSYRHYEASDEYKFINGYTDTIDLNLHVPRITAQEFIRRIITSLNLVVEFKDGGLVFRPADHIIQQIAVELDNVDPATVSISQKKPTGMVLNYAESSREQYVVSGQLQPYEWSYAEQQVYLPFNTFPIREGLIDDAAVNGLMRIPHTRQVGKSPALDGKYSDLPFYLLFHRANGLTSQSKSYVYATYDDNSYAGTAVSGAISLEMEDLALNLFEDSLDVKDYNELRFDAVITLAQLLQLREWGGCRVQFWHPLGMVTALIKEVETTIEPGHTEFIRARFTGLLVQ